MCTRRAFADALLQLCIHAVRTALISDRGLSQTFETPNTPNTCMPHQRTLHTGGITSEGKGIHNRLQFYKQSRRRFHYTLRIFAFSPGQEDEPKQTLKTKYFKTSVKSSD
jgi:hypothetical protein